MANLASQMHNLVTRRSLIIAVSSGLISAIPGKVCGQELDVALHATTTGEYEIGIRATEEATVGGLVNMTMTVRWEAAAGGTIEESSLLSYCPSFRPFENGEGVVTYGNYNYYTILFESNIPVPSGCVLSTEERIIASFQITGLDGCWNVDVADDYYVQTNNKDYFISVGGSPYTGSITSSPIPGGDCPPCVAPELGALGSSGLSTCSGPLELWVDASGTALLYTWEGPTGQLPMGTQYLTPDSIHIPNALAGIYTVVLDNLCGSVSASITVSPVPCSAAPEITAISGSLVNQVDCNGQVTLNATLAQTGPCETYRWMRAGSLISESLQPAPFYGAFGAYTLIVYSACGRDTAMVLVEDEGACMPPTVEGITLLTAPCASPTLQLQASVDPGSSCVSYTWTTPTGQTVTAGTTATLPTAYGTYQFIATNSCGSDTATFEQAVDPNCEAPEIVGWIHSPFDCIGDAVTVSAQFRGTCVQAVLSLPSGLQVNVHDSVQVWAQSGQYMLVASNGCGSDTVHFTLPVPNCIPPQILSQWGDTLLCGNLQLLLQPVVQVTGCYTVVWTGPPGSNTPDGALTWTVTDPLSGNYTLTLTNACGQATASLDVLRFNTTNLFQQVCDNSPILDMQALTGMAGEGIWTLQGVPHSSFYDPAIDSSGYYHLMDPTIPLECPTHILHVHELPYLSAGISDTAYVCSVDEPFAMIDSLGGSPDPGGIWTFGLLPAPHSPLFDPAVDGTRVFRYYHDGPQYQCSNGMASLMVFETEATSWYLDADADGFGDTAVMVLSCDTVSGHVANNSDECPLAYGTIGSPCDDELSWTTNDVLTADCICAGDLTTDLPGTDEKSAFRIWPNPNSAGHLFMRMAQTLPGSTEVTIHNMIGEAVAVSRLRSTVDAGTYLLDVTDLAAGPYQLEVRNSTTRSSARFIITR